MGKKSWERLCEEREFNAFYQALAQQSCFEQIGRFLQHGSTTRLMHSVAVAYYSYRLLRSPACLFTGKKWCGGLYFTITFFTTPRMETPHTSGIGPVTPGLPQKTRNVKCHSPRLKRTQSAAICFLSQQSPPNIGKALWSPWWIRLARCMNFFPGGHLMPNCRRMLRVFPLWLALKSSFCCRKWQGKGCNSLA